MFVIDLPSFLVMFSIFFDYFCMFVTVASQNYRVTVPEESAISGNSALFKCNIPSFVADFLEVTGWINSEGLEYSANAKTFGNLPSCKD